MKFIKKDSYALIGSEGLMGDKIVINWHGIFNYVFQNNINMNNLNNQSSYSNWGDLSGKNSPNEFQRIDPFRIDESDNDFTRQKPGREPDINEPSKIDPPEPLSPPAPVIEPQKSVV